MESVTPDFSSSSTIALHLLFMVPNHCKYLLYFVKYPFCVSVSMLKLAFAHVQTHKVSYSSL